MGNTVGHNTEMMREWSGNIESYSAEYDGLINTLYNLVEGFVSSDFTGGLSKDFESNILDQKENFKKLSGFLTEVADLVKATSRSIDSDEEELKQMINQSNILG